MKDYNPISTPTEFDLMLNKIMKERKWTTHSTSKLQFDVYNYKKTRRNAFCKFNNQIYG